MSQKTYRINTSVNNGDKVINVQLKQGIDTLNILSLEINPEDAYQLHTSDYGVIVGRVLANDAFGVPNVKVSVFVPLDSSDENDNVISKEYPYKAVQSTDENGIRYNLLSTDTYGGIDGNHKILGTFPNKNMVLDNDGEIEVYDKYWKYTTTTNQSGDYMLFGVPTGTCQVHYDCDLSDIGIISQKPYDLINKGYNANLFKSASEFKDGNLDDAVHILSQDASVFVYPFWGESSINKIGITRHDINLKYKFEPSCIFIGSCITDSQGNYITTYGMPNGNCGRFGALATSTGNIEIIRKTPKGNVEEVTENVKGIINGNGVWCYSIPMNLDRIGTDEFGNTVTIDDPNRGIPTRACVRFRISLNDNTSAKAYTGKILVPCNPKLKYDRTIQMDSSVVDKDTWSNYYEFGTNTPDSCFRDLYWGKVYSIKQYYPRLQYGLNKKPSKKEISGESDSVSGVDYQNYPKWNGKPFACISSIDNTSTMNVFPYNTMYSGAENPNDADTKNWFIYHLSDHASNGSMVSKGLFFCFENDWINGCLYFPKLQITVSKKTNGEYIYDYFGKLNDNDNGSGNTYSGVYVGGRHDCNLKNGKISKKNATINIFKSLIRDKKEEVDQLNPDEKFFKTQEPLKVGFLTKKTTSLGQSVFYYRCGGESNNQWYRLYATDIVLLGNITDIYDCLPKLYEELPSSTALFPPMFPPKELTESGMNMNGYQEQLEKMYHSGGEDTDCCDIFLNYYAHDEKGWWIFKNTTGKLEVDNFSAYTSYSSSNELLETCKKSAYSRPFDKLRNFDILCQLQLRYSLFFGDKVFGVQDRLIYLPQSFVNLSRICELDVSNDQVRQIGDKEFPVNGIIDKTDIESNENRSAFASMNYEVTKYDLDPKTGRKKYAITPLVLVGFDGRLQTYVNTYQYAGEALNASNQIDETPDNSYIQFRYGSVKNPLRYNGTKIIDYQNDPMLITENSLYFYFGLFAGNSAIDEFKNKYGISAEEDEEDTNESIITLERNASGDCVNGMAKYGYTLTLNPNLKTPVEIYIYKQEELVDKRITESLENIDLNLEVGKNTIEVTDAAGRTYSYEYKVKKENISLDYIVGNHLLKINKVNNLQVEQIIGITGNNNTVFINTYPGPAFKAVFSKDVEIGSSTINFDNSITDVGLDISPNGLSCDTTHYDISFGQTKFVATINSVPIEKLEFENLKFDSRNVTNCNGQYCYNFKEDEVAEQMEYLGNMISAVYGITYFNSSTNRDDYKCVWISPNPNLFTFNDVNSWNTSGSGSTQVYSVNGMPSINDAPYLVGQNYPVSSSSKTLIKKKQGGTYTENKVLNCSGTSIASNYFGFVNIFNGSDDKPSSTIPHYTTTTEGNFSGITNMYSIQTVDKRLDYEIALKTPLLTTDGKIEINGGFSATIYGGIRFDTNDNNEITCYKVLNNVITGRPTSSAALFSSHIYEDGGTDTDAASYKNYKHISESDYTDEVFYSGETKATESLNFDMISHKPDFGSYSQKDGILKIQSGPGEEMTCSFSYKSGIELIHDDIGGDKYDILYECKLENLLPSYSCPGTLDGSSLQFTVSEDELYNGSTYTFMPDSYKENDFPDLFKEFGKLNSLKVLVNESKYETKWALDDEYRTDSGHSFAYKEITDGIEYIPDSKLTYKLTYKLDSSAYPGENSYITIPTLKLYTENDNTLLKQAIVYNRGYKYYIPKITITPKNYKTVFDIELTNATIKSIGTISNYWSFTYDKDNRRRDNITSVSFDKSKQTFTISCAFLSNPDNGYKVELYFQVENGLRYKVVLKWTD